MESCFITRVEAKPVDADHGVQVEPMNLTSQALVGIIVKDPDENLG